MSRKGRKKAGRQHPAPDAPISTTAPEAGSGGQGTPPTETRGKTFFAVALSLVVASLLTGVVVGRLTSPKYDKKENLVDYAVRSSGIIYTQWNREPTDLTVPARGFQLRGGVIEYSCGFKKQLRDFVTGNEITDEDLRKLRELSARGNAPRHTGASQSPNLQAGALAEGSSGLSRLVIEHTIGYIPPLHPSDALGIATPGVSAQEVIAVLLGAGEVYSLRSATTGLKDYWVTLRSSSWEKKTWQGVKLFITAASGFGIGFYIGYEDNPPCADKAFQEQLASPSLWQTVGDRFLRVYQWHFERDNITHAINAINTKVPGSPTLRTFYYGIKAAPASDEEKLISKRARNQLADNSEQTDPLQYLPAWVDVIDRVGDIWGPRFIWDSTAMRTFNRSIHEHLLWHNEHDGIYTPADPYMAMLIDQGAPDISMSASRKYAESLWNAPQ